MEEQKPTQVVVRMQKSPATAFLLAFFFGPLGMLYSTVVGALIMMVVTPIIAIPTAGLGLFLTQPACIIWAVLSVNAANKKS